MFKGITSGHNIDCEILDIPLRGGVRTPSCIFFSWRIFIIVLEILRTGDNNWIWVVQEAVSVHLKFSFGVQCFSGWIHQSLFELFWSIPVVVLLSPDSCESIPDARSKLTLQLAPSKDRMYIYLVQSSHLVVSNSLWSQGLQQPSPTQCPSPTPRACSNSCPSNHCCHPTISSSGVPFSSCLLSFQHQGLFK